MYASGNYRRKYVEGSAFAALLCCGLPQESGAQTVEEIVVTAQKREESLQDTAISITAIGAQKLEQFKINDFEDYLTLVPGLSSNFGGPVSDRGVRPIGLRGVQTMTRAITDGQNTVGFYVNNTPIPAANPRLVDLERIEVLRGPQGTLYGSSSLAGAIKLITKRPSFQKFEGQTQVGLSSTKHGGANYEVEAAVNLPLSERAAVRVSGYVEETSGYIDFIDVDAVGAPTGMTKKNTNDMSARGGRAALAVDFTENLRLDASLLYSDRKVDSWDSFSRPAPELTYVGRSLRPRFDEFLLAEVTLDWRVGPVQIVSTTGWFDAESNQVNDITDALAPLLTPPPPVELRYDPYANENEELTHETRVQSTLDGPFQYVAGVFYADREEFSYTSIANPGKDSLLGVFPIPPGGPLFSNISPRWRKEFGIFGEAYYDVTDRWRLVAGLRYFEFEFETLDHFIGTNLLVPDFDYRVTGEAKAHGTVPKFRVEYRPGDNTLIYATAAEGFRMGGKNFPLPEQVPSCAAQIQAVFGVPTAPKSFKSDSLWSYELGSKSTLLGGRVQVNGAIFQIDWQDTQIPSGSLCQFVGAVLNVGAVRNRGAEVEIQAAPLEGLTLMLSGSYVDAEITEDFRIPGATRVLARAGDPVPEIPDWTFSSLADYRFPAFGDWEGFARGDYRYQAARRTQLTSLSTRDSFGVSSVRFGVADPDWEVSVFVENLTDEAPSLAGIPATETLAGRDLDRTIVPRTYGLNVRRRF